jgi:hypothetical protein
MSSNSGKSEGAWTPMKVEETRNEVLRRAAKDAAFRQRCLKNPSAAIAEVSGLELPEGAPPVRFVERLEEIVIVLPPLAGTELADRDLELVAGGQGLQEKAERAAKDANSGKIAQVVGGGVISQQIQR